MKRLSIEEKAKRYDEAIKRAKKINNEQRAQPFNVMTRVFPELAESESESEDERIRKTIDNCIDWFSSDSCFFKDVSQEECFAWLKKQGEPTDIPADAVLDSNKDGLIADTVRHKKELVTCPICGTKIKKQGGHASNFKVGDVIKRPNSKVTYKVTNIDNYGFQLDGGHWFRLDRKSEFEPAKYKSVFWSEEEEKMLDEIHEFFDKHMINPIKHDTDDYAKFIKSLKDRVQSQNHWKPSDEQMKYLAKAITTLGDEGDCKTTSILNDLRLELKKLREE